LVSVTFFQPHDPYPDATPSGRPVHQLKGVTVIGPRFGRAHDHHGCRRGGIPRARERELGGEQKPKPLPEPSLSVLSQTLTPAPAPPSRSQRRRPSFSYYRLPTQPPLLPERRTPHPRRPCSRASVNIRPRRPCLPAAQPAPHPRHGELLVLSVLTRYCLRSSRSK
jgi:hypothetical protein